MKASLFALIAVILFGISSAAVASDDEEGYGGWSGSDEAPTGFAGCNEKRHVDPSDRHREGRGESGDPADDDDHGDDDSEDDD
jgi:hypothetical protein